MKRRSVLCAVPIALAGSAGCLGGDGGGFAATPASTDATPTPDDALIALRQNLEQRGVDVLSVSGDGEIVITIQTSGHIEEDIRRVAGGYATLVGSLDRSLTVRVEDRGLRQTTFEIRQTWATQFADDRLSDGAYLDRINGTRSGG